QKIKAVAGLDGAAAHFDVVLRTEGNFLALDRAAQVADVLGGERYKPAAGEGAAVGDGLS
ncbi:MAG: hypothetical protein QG638_2090, partial [Pseudomonadota bacterium]|nr:hypothetical protein [Pseudomonadota bacterium]